jgi:hypothetical protein
MRLVAASIGTLMLLAAAAPAFALPPIPPYVAAHYSGNAKFGEAFSGLKMKCDLCHTPGADKKAKGHGLNDFGQAVHDHLKHKDFLAAHKLAADNPEEAAKAKKLIADALTAAEAEKSAAGQTFGELIQAGKLPGKN